MFVRWWWGGGSGCVRAVLVCWWIHVCVCGCVSVDFVVIRCYVVGRVGGYVEREVCVFSVCVCVCVCVIMLGDGVRSF